MKAVRPLIYPVGPSIAYVPLTRGQFALIDLEDAEWVSSRNWHSTLGHSGFYAVTNVKGDDGVHRVTTLHRMILCPGEGMVSDHKNGNTLDDRRCNLREATLSQNNANRSAARTNKCGFIGVSWRHRQKRWGSSIRVKGRVLHLGYFKDQRNAIDSYRTAAIEHHGEFTRVKA